MSLLYTCGFVAMSRMTARIATDVESDPASLRNVSVTQKIANVGLI